MYHDINFFSSFKMVDCLDLVTSASEVINTVTMVSSADNDDIITIEPTLKDDLSDETLVNAETGLAVTSSMIRNINENEFLIVINKEKFMNFYVDTRGLNLKCCIYLLHVVVTSTILLVFLRKARHVLNFNLVCS